MGRLIAVIAFLGLALTVCDAQAQNNKLFNGNLDLTPGSVYYQKGCCEGTEDDVPGWLMFLNNPADDGSWVLVSPEAGQGHDLDMAPGPAGGGIMTAAASRPRVGAGITYTASVTYDNYFTPSLASYFIDWFDSSGGSLGSVGGVLGDPNGPFGYDPYNQEFSIVGVAPVGAKSAGVRFQSGTANYSGLAADSFSLVPEPTAAILMALAIAGLCGTTRGSRR
jgi:hypothetical protein